MEEHSRRQERPGRTFGVVLSVVQAAGPFGGGGSRSRSSGSMIAGCEGGGGYRLRMVTFSLKSIARGYCEGILSSARSLWVR